MSRTCAILSHTSTRIKTVSPRGVDWSEGVLIQHHTERGLGEIALDAAELAALLRQLPTGLLLQALVERGALSRLAPHPATQPRPMPGAVCACAAQPSLHVADAGCMRGEG